MRRGSLAWVPRQIALLRKSQSLLLASVSAAVAGGAGKMTTRETIAMAKALRGFRACGRLSCWVSDPMVEVGLHQRLRRNGVAPLPVAAQYP